MGRIKGSHNAQTTSVGHSRRKLSITNPLHSTLNNRDCFLSVVLQYQRFGHTFDAESAGEFCIERHFVRKDVATNESLDDAVRNAMESRSRCNVGKIYDG